MFPLRRYLAVLLIASLLVSDALTFWHVGNCACDANCEAAEWCQVAGQAPGPAGSRHESLACKSGCDHASNPFAKRRIKSEQSGALQSTDNAGDATSKTCRKASESSSHSHRSSDHDPSDCSLCRWLVTSRSDGAVQVQNVLIELAPLESLLAWSWSNPIIEPLHQELSRRGPPQLLSQS